MHRAEKSLCNLVLVGFMGAGKSTVGRHLAEALNLEFCDTDALIEERMGLDIPSIFAVHGEDMFRSVEADVVQQTARRSDCVIATGGGTLTNPESLAALLQENYVVWLNGPLDLLLARAREQGARPVLAGASPTQIAELYAARCAQYAQADLVVNVDLPTDQLARMIQHYWENARRPTIVGRQVPVAYSTGSYAVHVGPHMLKRCPELIPGPPRRAVLVTDDNVSELYAQRVLAAFRYAGWDVRPVVIPAGERHKNLQTLEMLYDACIDAGLGRDGCIIALAGGVTGDIAGMTAATYMRGVDFIQIPTTFLAQVDASVGGKVAVNLSRGKNLVGAFYQPRAVIADTATLCSLPHRELLSGLAEVIKHGVIAEETLLQYVEERLPDILTRDPDALAHCVYRSCVIKGAVVASDEKEMGLREVLNFGHTVAHALETVTAYSEFTHGEAVAIGMVTACHLSYLQGQWSADDVMRVTELLRRAGLPVNAPHVSIEAILQAMEHDKKARAGQVRMVLSPKVGSAQAGVVVERGQLRAALCRQQEQGE